MVRHESGTNVQPNKAEQATKANGRDVDVRAALSESSTQSTESIDAGSRDARLPCPRMNLDPHHPQRCLMVVDNDHDLVDSICEWIGLSSDWTVVPAYGPAEALAQASSAPPDVILLDMEMPEANGFDTAERLEQASGTKHSAILALTGNADLRDAALLDPRFTASMLKPADPSQLLVLLSKLVPEH